MNYNEFRVSSTSGPKASLISSPNPSNKDIINNLDCAPKTGHKNEEIESGFRRV
jgi:hypothetical protein